MEKCERRNGDTSKTECKHIEHIVDIQYKHNGNTVERNGDNGNTWKSVLEIVETHEDIV